LGRTDLRLKLEILERGIVVSPSARQTLTGAGSRPLTFHDYATTGGLTLRFGREYVNAPVDEWFCDSPAAELDLIDGQFLLRWKGDEVLASVLPLPGYLGTPDADGVMTHADRLRLSPVDGCSCSCAFCDSPQSQYRLRPLESLARALSVAASDRPLPPAHGLISGGTPRADDVPEFDETVVELVRASPVPMDVMMMPRSDTHLIDDLADAGIDGFAVNIELFGAEAAAALTPQKARCGPELYSAFWEHALEKTGGGRVRSLLIVGFEPEADTLAGVEYIASHGIDPVLSPFRPAPGTRFADQRPPSADVMERLHDRAVRVADRYGVRLGPRCVPCQHNVIAVAADA